MKYSPKLKKAMQEITKVLEKHDIGASIVLHTPGFSEHLLKLDPEYSCASFEADGNLRLRAKAEDFGGDVELRNQKIKDTSNMLVHLAEMTGNHFVILDKVSTAFDAVANASHGPGTHTSKQETDN